MKKQCGYRSILLSSLVALLLVSVTGCSSIGPYLGNRGRDLADIFTASVGVGGGAAAKVGMFTIGLLGNSDKAGLRAGTLFASTTEAHISAEQTNVFLYGMNHFQTKDTKAREKLINDFTLFGFGGLPPLSRIDPSFFQIEAVVAAGVSVRAGINIAEIFDFIVGWTTIDFLNDDLLGRQNLNLTRVPPNYRLVQSPFHLPPCREPLS